MSHGEKEPIGGRASLRMNGESLGQATDRLVEAARPIKRYSESVEHRLAMDVGDGVAAGHGLLGQFNDHVRIGYGIRREYTQPGQGVGGVRTLNGPEARERSGARLAIAVEVCAV